KASTSTCGPGLNGSSVARYAFPRRRPCTISSSGSSSIAMSLGLQSNTGSTPLEHLLPLNMLAAHRPSCEEYVPRNFLDPLMMAPHSGVVAASVKFHRWRLGFGQCSSHPIAWVSQGHTVHAFPCSLLFRQALVPSSFRLQVSR